MSTSEMAHDGVRQSSTANRDGVSAKPVPLLIGNRDAACMLGIGARTLWSITKCKAIPSRKIGSRVLYSPDELRAWISLGCPTEPGAADRVTKAMRQTAK